MEFNILIYFVLIYLLLCNVVLCSSLPLDEVDEYNGKLK